MVWEGEERESQRKTYQPNTHELNGDAKKRHREKLKGVGKGGL